MTNVEALSRELLVQLFLKKNNEYIAATSWCNLAEEADPTIARLERELNLSIAELRRRHDLGLI